MKKVFFVTTLNDKKLKDSMLRDAQIIAYRQDVYTKEDGQERTLFFQNLEFYPNRVGKVEFNPALNEVTLTFKVMNGEMLAVGSETGMTEKNLIKIK